MKCCVKMGVILHYHTFFVVLVLDTKSNFPASCYHFRRKALAVSSLCHPFHDNRNVSNAPGAMLGHNVVSNDSCIQ